MAYWTEAFVIYAIVNSVLFSTIFLATATSAWMGGSGKIIVDFNSFGEHAVELFLVLPASIVASLVALAMFYKAYLKDPP